MQNLCCWGLTAPDKRNKATKARFEMPNRSCCAYHWRQRSSYEESLALVIREMGGERKRCEHLGFHRTPFRAGETLLWVWNWWKLEFDRISSTSSSKLWAPEGWRTNILSGPRASLLNRYVNEKLSFLILFAFAVKASLLEWTLWLRKLDIESRI